MQKHGQQYLKLPGASRSFVDISLSGIYAGSFIAPTCWHSVVDVYVLGNADEGVMCVVVWVLYGGLVTAVVIVEPVRYTKHVHTSVSLIT